MRSRARRRGPYMSDCLCGDNITYEHEYHWCLAAGPLVHRGFKPLRGLIQGVQTIVLNLVDLIHMRLSSSDFFNHLFIQ